MPPELKNADLPPHIEHTIILCLAKVFLEVLEIKGTFPTKGDLMARGIEEPDDYARRGYIIAPVGRFAGSYQPGRDVRDAMAAEKENRSRPQTMVGNWRAA